MSFDLLPSQRNELFRLIQDRQLSPAAFKWTKVYLDSPDDYFPKLEHTATGFYFTVNMYTRSGLPTFHAEYSPGTELKFDSSSSGNWHHVTRIFLNWLDNVKRESELPDLWSGLQNTQFLQEQPSDNLAFSPDELIQVRESLNEIKTYVLKTYGITAAQQKIIDSRFDHMEEAASRMGRKDWLNLVIGNLLGVASALALTGDGTKDLFAFAALVIKRILGTVLYLAGPH